MKQRGDEFVHRFRSAAARFDRLAATFLVVGQDLGATLVKTIERPPMTRQNQNVIGNFRGQSAQRPHVVAERITRGLHRPDADIRGDLLKHLIGGRSSESSGYSEG